MIKASARDGDGEREIKPAQYYFNADLATKTTKKKEKNGKFTRKYIRIAFMKLANGAILVAPFLLSCCPQKVWMNLNFHAHSENVQLILLFALDKIELLTNTYIMLELILDETTNK